MNTRNASTVGAALLVTLLCLTTNAHGGDRRRVRSVSPPSAALEIAFLEGALVEAGTIVWRGGTRRSTVTARTVRMRVGEPAGESRGNVTVRAFLETADARCTVRVDGIPLTAAPRVVHRNAPVGIPFAHRIEIEVPVTAPDGPLHASIGWEVTQE